MIKDQIQHFIIIHCYDMYDVISHSIEDEVEWKNDSAFFPQNLGKHSAVGTI